MSTDMTLMLEAHKYWKKVAKAVDAEVVHFHGKLWAILEKGNEPMRCSKLLGDKILELQQKDK